MEDISLPFQVHAGITFILIAPQALFRMLIKSIRQRGAKEKELFSSHGVPGVPGSASALVGLSISDGAATVGLGSGAQAREKA